MFRNKITNLGVPMDGGDAATKAFVIKRGNRLVQDYGLELKADMQIIKSRQLNTFLFSLDIKKVLLLTCERI